MIDAARIPVVALLTALAVGVAGRSAAQDPDDAPIHYHSAEVDDPVARLQRRLDSGEAALEWRDRWGWLPSVLEELGVATDSQTLVFSKTSLQTRKISPRRPRALYYNDDVYVGYVQRGDVLEIASVDPVNGPVFYTLAQEESESPRFERDTGECLACHDNHRTSDVPGLLVRSVYPDRRGHALLALGDTATDPTTPITDRYGGWYVTGDPGVRHRGNALYDEEGEPEGAPLAMGQTCRAEDYLAATSDVVALMVLEHQSQMHNAITRASYEARRATAYDKQWGPLLEKPEGFVFDVSVRRLDAAAEQLLECLLLCGEAPLAAPVKGSPEFAEAFAAAARRDPEGRSLRDLDLTRRLFRHPCSYLIHSESFAALPQSILDRLGERLGVILRGEEDSPRFAHLSAADREAIAAILRATDAPVRF